MSARKRTQNVNKNMHRRIQRNDSNSEDSDNPSQSPDAGPSGSRAVTPPPSKRAMLNRSSAFENGSPSKQSGLLKNWINKCVLYILVCDRKKHAIKKADIMKNVFEDQNSKENYTIVLKESSKRLKKTFGLQLLALKNQKNSYILVNILDPDQTIRELAEYSDMELQKRGLILLLLTIIFMNENSIAEDKLWKALERLEIRPNSPTPHPVFGNVKKLVTVELVREMYLEYTRVSKDPVQYEFTWGERAHQEVKKKELLEFACQMMGDCKPEDWKLQYIDSNRSENGNAEV